MMFTSSTGSSPLPSPNAKDNDDDTKRHSAGFRIRRPIRYPGDRVTRKYERAAVRRAEYRKLKAIVPAVASRRSVSKLTVIEEAIRYIDELHTLLADRLYPKADYTFADELVRRRCHQQFVASCLTKPDVFMSTLLSPVCSYDIASDVIWSRDDVVIDLDVRRHRNALHELQQSTRTANYCQPIER